jgi:hypothetical protein
MVEFHCFVGADWLVAVYYVIGYNLYHFPLFVMELVLYD